MSAKSYNRKQGEFELRVLKDGRLVMIAPDETLLEIAASLGGQTDSSKNTTGEQDAEKGRAECRQTAGPGRDEATDG